MNRPHPQRMWECFLRIGESAGLNAEKNAELSLEEQGKVAQEAALTALNSVKNIVLPRIRQLESDHIIDWYSFLIHDRVSGVPVTDNGAYIHLRISLINDYLSFQIGTWLGDGTMKQVAPFWSTRRMECQEHEVEDWWLLGEQSALVLNVIERYADLDGLPLLEKLGQMGHYFGNMTQLPFPRPEWMSL